MNLSDSEAAVSALSEFLLQKYQNVKQAGAVFLEEEDFYADVKMVRKFVNIQKEDRFGRTETVLGKQTFEWKFCSFEWKKFIYINLLRVNVYIN